MENGTRRIGRSQGVTYATMTIAMELSPLFRELASFPVGRDDRQSFFFTRDGDLGQLHRTGFRIRELPGGRVISDAEMFESPPSAVAVAAVDDWLAVTTTAFFDRAQTVVFRIAHGAVDG